MNKPREFFGAIDKESQSGFFYADENQADDELSFEFENGEKVHVIEYTEEVQRMDKLLEQFRVENKELTLELADMKANVVSLTRLDRKLMDERNALAKSLTHQQVEVNRLLIDLKNARENYDALAKATGNVPLRHG